MQQTTPPLHPPSTLLQTINLEEIPILYLHKYGTSEFNNTKDKHTEVQADQSILSTI